MKTEDIENQDEQKWKSVNQLLSRAGSRLNILEEEIDVEVQHQYMDLLEHLIKGGDFKALREDAIVHVQDLFDEAVDAEKKKTLLILLSMVDDISIYRSIESFQKQDTPIKPWATIALQQSRMLIQSNLLDESTVFVSTGLGGHDTLLRYFCVYVANEGLHYNLSSGILPKKRQNWSLAKAKERSNKSNNSRNTSRSPFCYQSRLT